MIFTYVTLCGKCQENRKENRLKYEFGQAEVFCDEGHKWPSIEDALEYNTINVAPTAESPAEEAAMEILDKAVDNGLHLEAPPAPFVEPVIPKEETKKMPDKPATTPAKAKAVPPTVAKALAKMTNGNHPESPVIVEGGDMLVTLRISDTYVGAVKQEAENQKLSVQEHLQNIFSWGIEQGWFAILLLSLLLFAGVARAQMAHVITLKPADAAEVKAKWDALQKAQADWDAEQKKILTDYTIVPNHDPDAGTEVCCETLSGTTGSGIVWNSTSSGDVFNFDGAKVNSWDYYENCVEKQEKSKRCADEKEARDEADRKRRFYRAGWENGIEFDKDFKFIVPKKQTSMPTSGSCVVWNCNITIPYTVPAFTPTIQGGSTTPAIFNGVHSW